MKILYPLLFIIIFVSIPFSAFASDGRLDYGGKLVFVIPCTCSPILTYQLTFAGPFYIPAPLEFGDLDYSPILSPPVTGDIVPGAPATYSAFKPFAPLDIFNLGDYVPGAEACYIISGPSCVLLPAIGLVSRVGSSLLPSPTL